MYNLRSKNQMTSKTGVTGLIICCLESPVLALNTSTQAEENFPYRKVFSSKCYYEATKVAAYCLIVRRKVEGFASNQRISLLKLCCTARRHFNDTNIAGEKIKASILRWALATSRVTDVTFRHLLPLPSSSY